MTELTPHNANQIKGRLTSTSVPAVPEITIYENNLSGAPGAIAVKSIDLIYPCTVWVTPDANSTVDVFTSFDGVTKTEWPNGVVSSFSSLGLASCLGTIIFVLKSGTGANIGIT